MKKQVRNDRAAATAKAERWLLHCQGKYASAERRLIKAALVGCLGRDREASSSARPVDVRAEVSSLRWCRNELTVAEKTLRGLRRRK